jgi:hypothetical protein
MVPVPRTWYVSWLFWIWVRDEENSEDRALFELLQYLDGNSPDNHNDIPITRSPAVSDNNIKIIEHHLHSCADAMDCRKVFVGTVYSL